MNKVLTILTAILLFSQVSFGQSDNGLTGQWVAVKIEFTGNKKVINPQNIIPTDTLIFEGSNFEQKSLVNNETNDKIFWTQKGIYKTTNGKLFLQDRSLSTGSPNIDYPDIEYKFEIKNGQLKLGQKSKLPDNEYVWVWTYYNRN